MKVTVFKPCPLKPGQKIRIEGSALKGDWEIIKVSDFKITIRCPITGKELTKDRFFMFSQEKEQDWPASN
jgi:hypothetical protein